MKNWISLIDSPLKRKKRKTEINFPDSEEEFVTFSFNNVYQQNFDFPYEMMKHISTNANYNIVKKLYFSCKCFPGKFKLLLIDTLQTNNLIIMNNKRSRINVSDFQSRFRERLWIGESVCTSEATTHLWISKIDRCTIKKLEIAFIDLTFSDFKILTKSGTIEDLNVGKIFDENNKQIPVENICALVPNAWKIDLSFTHVTQKTAEKLCQLETPKILKKFHLNKVDNILDSADYLKFFQKRSDSTSQFFICYCSDNVPTEMARNFCVTVKTEISKWHNPKPLFSSVVFTNV